MEEVDIMVITRVKMEMGSFLHKLEMKIYAWIQFHVYTSLK